MTSAPRTYATNGRPALLGQNAQLRSYLADNSNGPKQLFAGNTHFVLDGEDRDDIATVQVRPNAGLNWVPGGSLLELTHPLASVAIDAAVTFNNVVFSTPTGRGVIRSENASALTLNQLVFRGDGDLLTPVVTDTLLFASGKSYRLAAGETQTVNDFWRILGNNCTPISLRSTALGDAASVSVPPAGRVLANSVQMRDISATGGATFRAGILSTDIANSNRGWIFDRTASLSDVGFLGEDRGLCLSNSLELDANNFSQNESYRWQDGSTAATFTVTTPGTYSVAVTFDARCTVVDSVVVTNEAGLNVNLPADTSICAGDSIRLEAAANFSGVRYSWQDGSVEQSLAASTSGRFSVTVDLDGCRASDTLELTVSPLPDFSLGGDQTACANEEIELTVPDLGGTIRWNDGDTSTRKTFTTDAFAIVEVSNQLGCASQDSAMLTFTPLPLLELGPDTTVCSDRPFLLTAANAAGIITWPDGSGGDSYRVPSRGTFVATLEADGCLARDTITVDRQDCKDFQAYLPTAFSPDGDGTNDGFAPLFDEDLDILSYRMEVFSRWGERVFVTEDPFARWDGKIAGEDAPYGVYIYIVDITYRDDRGPGSDVLSGDVMLLR